MRALRPDMTVRLVARDWPATRPVFVRRGEEEDRTVFGHLEPLENFARRRGVPLQRLLEELSAASGAPIQADAGGAERAHRPFLLWAVIITLTLGAGWGAWLLYRIGQAGDFAAASPAAVVAHGAAQFWGFVALFIAGISLRFLYMGGGRKAPRRLWRDAVLALLLAGIAGGFAWALLPASWGLLGLLSGVLLLTGGVLYLLLIAPVLLASLGQVWARFALAAAGWLLVWAAYTLYLRAAARDAGPAAFTLLERQLLIDLALYGLALGSVYGYGIRLIPGFLAAGSPHRRLLSAAFWLHNAGLAVLVSSRLLGAAWFAAAGATAIACGAIASVAALRFLRGRPVVQRQQMGHPWLQHFIRLAFFWLIAGVAAAAILEIYAAATGTAPPHAFVGAVRHALTVGFLVTLIMGIAQRLVPVLGHTQLAWPQLVPPILLLVGAGNLLRVASEVLTAWLPAAYPVMPLSAVLEFAALTLFGANLLRTLWPRRDVFLRRGKVDASTPLATLLAHRPALEDELIAWGFGYVARVRQIPAELTIAGLAEKRQLDPDALAARINDALDADGAAATARE